MRLDQLLPGIGDLRADDVQSYLRSRGWSLVDDLRQIAVVYADERGNEVVVPLKREFADYARRLGELVETLARIEERPPAELLEDLSPARATAIADEWLTAFGRLVLWALSVAGDDARFLAEIGR